MSLARRISGAIGLALAIGACTRHDGTAPVSYSMAGDWYESEALADTAHALTHYRAGVYSLQQTAEAFAGTGQATGLCHGSEGDFVGVLASTSPFTVSAGTQQGRHVAWDTPYCHYDGEFDEGNPDRIWGRAVCTYQEAGVTYTLTGDWLVER